VRNAMLRNRLRLGVWVTVSVVLAGCGGSLKLAPNDADVILARQLLDAPNPGTPGSFRVMTMYYGSGTDRRRPEFRDSVTLKTDPVDASKLVDLGDQADSRNSYWGFEPKNFPINGRVWHPDGPGPFPLVLIVHGNHNMREFSDPGYGYLGELLASRGFILTSVDMNFVNGGIRGENDARGWLLLKHLQAWREFNRTEDNPFFGKVDMENIAVMGHSRGGEAVGHAAAFNRLSHYPDDANLTFDFGFGIQSVIAIAPVDGQYLPTGRFVPMENVNYLVFHGSHDGDVSSFHGLRQYHRVRFTDGTPRFRAAVYVYRANHGQWNTVWGSHDNGRRSGRILDLRTLIDAEDQREFGKIYISAFLESTLKGDKRYLPIFRDHRVIGGWLPKTMYITRFQESSFRPVADFEEDIDVTTGTKSKVTLRGDSLATWREGRLVLRSRNRPTTSNSQNNQAVWLGWNNRIAGEDTTKLGTAASYTVELPATLAGEWALDRNATLDFLLAPTKDIPGPRKAARDSSEADGREGPSGRQQDDEEKPPVDLSIELSDAKGVTASVPLTHYGAVRRPLEISMLRRKDMEKDRFPRNYEVVLQTYSIMLGDFLQEAPQLDLSELRAIRFVFDRAYAGTVIVDDIGFSHMDPAFTRVSAGGR
jgi:dienelactone hydrolase